MKRIHMMIGIPGSGKTTLVNKLIKEKGYKVVSSDIVRQLNPGIEETKVFTLVYEMIGDILSKEDDVIYDATNVTKKVRDRFKDRITPFGIEYELIGYYFPTHFEECIKRVAKRNQDPNELFLPLDVISSYGKTCYPPTYEENFAKTILCTSAQDLLQGLVKDTYQGYALYYKNKDQIIEEYSGFCDINKNEAIKYDTNFRLASVSKQFIAYAILSLIKQGLLKYEDSLFDQFDRMPEYTKKITIKNLLNHTSGILDYEDMEHTEKQVCDNDVLDFVRGTKDTYFEIGSKYQYSNTAYVLLGLIIEKHSKKDLNEYLKTTIFDNLDMTNSQMNTEGVSIITPRAYGHIRENGHLVLKDQYWCSATRGDGGIYSSVKDLKKWLKHIQSLDAFYQEMEETNIVNDVNIEYGYGLRVKEILGHKFIYHCGDTIGTNTIIGFIKDLDIEFIFLTNENSIDTEIFNKNLRKILGA